MVASEIWKEWALPDILLVDDSPTVLHYAELILSQQGYTVHTAETAEQGLSLIKEVRPAAAFVDYVLPKMNGVSFCEVVRGNDMFPSVPLILMSSRSEEELLAVQNEITDLHFLSKPFEPEDMLAVLESALGKQS